MISIYFLLPIIISLTALLMYVLIQNPSAIPNRLFALYIGVVLLIDSTTLIRLTTTNNDFISFVTALIIPLLALSDWMLIWLVLALFLLHRYMQRRTRWLIALPYVLAFSSLLIDEVFGLKIWYLGFQRNGQGFVVLAMTAASVWMLVFYVIGQLVPVVMLACIAVRHREQRAPAVLILGGLLFTIVSVGLVSRSDSPILIYICSLPLYSAFAWATLRYGLFRPSTVALQTAIDHLPDSVLILDGQRRVRYSNQIAKRLLMATQDIAPIPLASILEHAQLQEHTPSAEPQSHGHRHYIRTQPPQMVLDSIEAEIHGDPIARHVLVLRDITMTEEQHAALQRSSDSLVKRTRDLETTLRELRQRDDVIIQLVLPLIPIADGVLVLPLIGSFDRERSAALLTRLLAHIESQQAHTVLLDMTGVTAFDHAFAEVLHRVITGAQLMGARCALCGVRPEMAQSLVHEGVDSSVVLVFATLQAGIAHISAETHG